MDETPKPTGPDLIVRQQAGEVFTAFLRVGLTAFGGPAAQISTIRREFVERRGWLADAAFADLLAFSLVLPGSAGVQLGMAVGLRCGGRTGLIAAGLGIALPGAVAAIALGCVAPRLEAGWSEGMAHGLQIAAAAVIAQALIGLVRTRAAGPVREGMAIGAAAGLLIASGGPAAQVVALGAGALFGLIFLAEPVMRQPAPAPIAQVPLGLSLGALAAFAGLLTALPLLAAWSGDPASGVASVFFRVGALVFGGDHVAMPLLQSEVVGRGWIDIDTFLSGYGAVQALPGSMFSVAGFLGAAQSAGPGGWLGGLIAILAIYAPGILLTVGALPFWTSLQTHAGARGAIAGVNAVAVGILAAALWNPVLSQAITRPSDWLLAAGAFVFLAVAKAPPWLVVVGFAAAMGLFHPIRV